MLLDGIECQAFCQENEQKFQMHPFIQFDSKINFFDFVMISIIEIIKLRVFSI